MYSHVDHRRNKAVLRQLFSIFLIFTLYFNSISQAHAAGMSGWTLSNPVAKGASVAYDGLKNVIINGKNVAKTSTALITPTATQVAKLLGKGVAGVALSFAVEQLLGKVDWVLDPANNSVIYTESCKATSSCPQFEYLYTDNTGGYFSSADEACKSRIKTTPWPDRKFIRSFADTPTHFGCVFDNYGSEFIPVAVDKVVNPAYDPTAEEKPKSIPLDTLAQKVISNAEAGNTDAQVATTAAAADIVAEAQNDDAKARPIVNQLEANSKTETDADSNTATGEAKPNTETGGTDLALEFPTFCGWAPQVCEAAQVVINFPTTLTDWWNTGKTKAESWADSISKAYTATKEWLQEDKDNNDDGNEKPEINQIDIGQLDTGTFKASAGCPQPIQVPVHMGTGGNVEISYEPICQFARSWSFVAPLIGFLSGALIIVGVGRKGEDGEI